MLVAEMMKGECERDASRERKHKVDVNVVNVP